MCLAFSRIRRENRHCGDVPTSASEVGNARHVTHSIDGERCTRRPNPPLSMVNSFPTMRLAILAFIASAAALTACAPADSSDDPTAPPQASLNGAPITPGTDPGSSSTPGAPGTSTSTPPPAPSPPDMATINKRKAQMLTSFWENDTTVFQYAFARNNHDGYGYTTGRIGFTTATGDTAQVVQCFDAAFGATGNPLKKYENALTTLRNKMLSSGQMQGDITTIDAIGDFVTDWESAANNAASAPAMDKCQDDLVDSDYWTPTVAIATKWGLTTSLANAALYDAIVVHGEDNVDTLAKGANDDVGNTAQTPASAPLSLTAESAWLQAFMTRRTALINSSSAWSAAIARGANYEQWRRDGNFAFDAPLDTDATANVVFPGKGYSSNGYQACIVAADGTVTGPAQCTAPVSD